MARHTSASAATTGGGRRPATSTWDVTARLRSSLHAGAPERILDDVPIIAVFFGIVIRMFYKEHEPAHFHAEHQGQQATFDFDGKILAGSIQSKTAVRLIRQWAALHGPELVANWANMKAGTPLNKIPPLE